MHLTTFVDDVAVRSSGKSSNFAISAVLELLRLLRLVFLKFSRQEFSKS
jgi:hypothetical protein